MFFLQCIFRLLAVQLTCVTVIFLTIVHVLYLYVGQALVDPQSDKRSMCGVGPISMQ